MIVCTNCGFHNEDDDTFCGGCQEFLEWTGESLEADEPDSEVAEETDGEHRGLVERVVDTFAGRDEADGAAGSGSTTAVDTAEGGPGDSSSGGGVGLASETAERAEAAARDAERAQQEADERAAEQTRRTEQARTAAEEAERVRLEAEAKAAEEAEEAERLRAQLEAARRAREEAEEELAAEAAEAEQERDEAERRRQEAAQQRADATSLAEEEEQRARDTERDRAEAEARLQEEQAALEAVQAQVEAAEQARRESEERAAAEAKAAEQAAQAAEQAERARRESEERAKEEAEAAEQARRAAALVARPAATPKPEAGTSDGPTNKRAGGVKPGATRRDQRKPRRRPRKRDAAAAAAAAAATTEAAAEPSTGPVKPGRTKLRPPARTRKQEPSRKLRPGDLVCGQCGEGNNPERKFCRRCGNSLDESPVVKRPWYVRWLPQRKPKAVAAGTRPGRSGGSGRGLKGTGRAVKGGIGKTLRLVAMVTIAAGALGIAAVPSLRSTAMERGEQLYTSARRLVAPEYEPVVPQGATASSSLPGHRARRAIDNTSNRWWAEGAEGDGQGERLMVEFTEPVDIAVIGVTPGAAGEEFVEQPRPRQLHLVFDNGQTADLEIADEHTFQTFEVEGATGVTSVEVQVIEVWQGQSGSDLSVTGLEFRTVK